MKQIIRNTATPSEWLACIPVIFGKAAALFGEQGTILAHRNGVLGAAYHRKE